MIYQTPSNWKDLNGFLADNLKSVQKQHGAFYAFTREQLEERAQEGVGYVRTGTGLHIPKDKADSYQEAAKKAYEGAIEAHKAAFPKEVIIIEEMRNREAFYDTNCLKDIAKQMEDYGFTAKDVDDCWGAFADHCVANRW